MNRTGDLGAATAIKHHERVSEGDDQWAVLHCSAEFADLVIEKIRKRVPGAGVKRLMGGVGYLAWRGDPAHLGRRPQRWGRDGLRG